MMTQRTALLAFVAALLAAAATAPAAGASCVARSAPAAATVVELYTSEGCSSCPPADRWLGTLGGRADVVALGFHVDYWDGLGWKDRFASPAFTRRQSDSQRTSGARFSYTPQVIVDGRDWREWPSLPAASSRHVAPVALTFSLDGDGALRLQVDPVPPAGSGSGAAGALPARLAAEIAVVDDRLQSRVQAGENRGETLRHDDVVRAVVALPAWTGALPHAQRVVPAERTAVPALEAGASRHWTAVVRDADTGRPVQAVELRCGS
jgi:hypothetical protein